MRMNPKIIGQHVEFGFMFERQEIFDNKSDEHNFVFLKRKIRFTIAKIRIFFININFQEKIS